MVVIEISWFCVTGLYVARQKYAANIVCENLTTDLLKFDDLVTIIGLLLVVGECWELGFFSVLSLLPVEFFPTESLRRH